MFQEILIASLGLLAIPKNVGIDIENAYGKEKLLSESNTRALEENRETKEKLNNISETISEMAKSFGEAAVTEVTEDEIKKQEEKNKKVFIEELKNNLEGLEQNILFDDLYNDEKIQDEIYSSLQENEIMTQRELINVLEKNNRYILGFSANTKNDSIDLDIRKVIKAINSSYRVSNLNFIWKKKIDENKKNVSKQLEGVSQAISELANDITKKEEQFVEEKEKIKVLLNK